MDQISRVGAPTLQPKTDGEKTAAEEAPIPENVPENVNEAVGTEQRTEVPAEEVKEETAEAQSAGQNEQPRPVKDKQRGNQAQRNNERLGKPVIRENPNRRPNTAGGSSKSSAQEAKAKPVKANEAKKAPGGDAPAKEQNPAPAASPWKQAVERALRAAQSNENSPKTVNAEKSAQQQPITLEDHQDTHEYQPAGDEDDTI